MDLTSILQIISALIPIVGFSAAVVAAITYVRYKGTIDALKETAETYQRLANGYKEETEELKQEVMALKTQVEALQVEIAAQSLAFERVVANFTAILKKEGVIVDFPAVDGKEV